MTGLLKYSEKSSHLDPVKITRSFKARLKIGPIDFRAYIIGNVYKKNKFIFLILYLINEDISIYNSLVFLIQN